MGCIGPTLTPSPDASADRQADSGRRFRDRWSQGRPRVRRAEIVSHKIDRRFIGRDEGRALCAIVPRRWRQQTIAGADVSSAVDAADGGSS